MSKLNWKVIIRRVILCVCGLALGINVYMMNASKLMGNQLPMPFGVGFAVVLSGSMEPAMSTGDLIVVCEDNDYEVNDVVVYQNGYSLIVHRIVGIDGDEVVTKGDANNINDAAISVSDIKGKVVMTIPYLGEVMTLIKSPIATVLIVLAAIVLIESSYKEDRKSDNEELERIREEIRKLKEEE